MPKDTKDLQPGRELDKLIAEVVFGAKVAVINQRGGWNIDMTADLNICNNPIIAMDMVDGHVLKNYSTSFTDAWAIVEKLGQSGTQWRFSNKVFSNKYWWAYTEDAISQGDTMPHAICLTALKHIQEQAK